RSLTATASDAAGNTSAGSAAWSVVIDTLAPGAPIIAAASDDVGAYLGTVGNGGRSDDTTLTLTGTAEAGSLVTLRDGATVLGSVTADGAGGWSFTTGVLAEGARSFTATATDVAGNVSVASATYAVTIDTTPPAAPAITGATDNVGSIQGAVGNGGRSDDTTLTLAGTAESGSLVTIRDGGTAIGTAVANGTGAWSFTTGALANGSRVFTATATDSAGNLSGASAGYTVVVDTTAPTAPLILGATDDAGTVTGAVANGGRTDDATLALSGTAEAGSTVTLRDGATVVGSAIANGSGAWSLTTAALAEGTRSLTATATDAAGNASGASAAFAVTIDTTPPTAPAISAVTDGAGSITGTVAHGGRTDDTTLSLSGTAEAGSTVTVRDGATVVGSAIATAGGTWSLTTVALAEGARSLTATATDAAGNASGASAAFAVTIDTTPPAAPAITAVTDNAGAITGAVAPGGLTDDATPTLSGTAEAGSTVTIRDGATVLGTTTADGAGAWSFTPAVLAEGARSFTATATDHAGNVSAASAARTLTIASAAPGTPVITGVTDDVGSITGSVANGGRSNDPTLLVTGTAEAGSTVTIRDGATVLGTTSADAAGAWSFTTPALADGARSLTATASNAAGAVSSASTPHAVVIDTAAPATPALTTVTDNAGTITGTVAHGGRTDDTSLALAGTAEAGSTVTIRDGATVLGTTTANGAGAWSFTTAGLAEGARSLTVIATDAAGNASVASAAHAVVIDTTPPAAPAITAVTDNVGPQTGTVAQGGLTDDETPTLSGTAEAGSTIAIRDGATLLGTTIADGAGAWSFTTAGLADGPRSFTATATDVAGNASGTSAAYAVQIGTAAAATPAITAVTDDQAPNTGNVGLGWFTNDRTLLLGGTADAGHTVTIRDGATVLGTAVANAGGSWSFTTATLADGLHSFTATATGPGGTVSAASAAYTVTVDTVAPGTPTITGVFDDAAPQTGLVGPGGRTNDTTLTVTGTAEAGSLVYLRDGFAVYAVGTAAADGTWSLTTGTLLAGTRNFTVSAVDGAGNSSGNSALYPVVIDTVPPAAPVIGAVVDDLGSVTGPVGAGGVTNDTTLALSGTAEAGALVTIRNGATVLGTTSADAAGAWSFATAGLAEGAASLTATATDGAGNVSAASAALVLTIDTIAPNAPVILGPVAPSGSLPTLGGTAEAGSLVAIHDGATLLGTTTADGTGSWRFETAALNAQTYSLTATATDAAGNLSADSAAYGAPLALVLDRTTLFTSESGGVDGAVVRALNATGDVLVTIGGLDASEGALSASTLLLTAANNWTARLDVTGVNDRDADGDALYGLVLSASGAASVGITVSNADNDLAPGNSGWAGINSARRTVLAAGAPADAIESDDNAAITLLEGGTAPTFALDWRWEFSNLAAGNYRLQLDARSSGEAIRFAYSNDGGATWTRFMENGSFLQARTEWTGDYTVVGA
ncbi:MAG: hypothetical protein K2X74_21090, partial [Acetobacteraceae bacterium]|nr:hypothetical protein [Acetobacteraceae bacterium]